MSAPLGQLVCPQCARTFTIVLGDLRDGTIACGCRELQVVRGVVLSRGSTHTTRGRTDPALLQYTRRVRMLGYLRLKLTFRRFLRNRLLAEVMRRPKVGRLSALLERSPLTRQLWASGQWHLYRRYRFSTPSFLAALPALGLLADRQGLVLDAPCGMGHYSYCISRVVAGERLVAVDLHPPFAYSVRQFFVPDAGLVLGADMNEPLPLPSGQFGVVYCLDSFHYVEEKQALASELVRLLADDGVLALLHVHNRLQDNPSPGAPLSPAEYAKLFDGYELRMYPEGDLLQAFLEDRPFRLDKSASLESLNQANAIAIFVARSSEALSPMKPVRRLLAQHARNPQLSEMYRARRGDDDNVVLERRIPPTLEAEYGNMDNILPERVTVSGSDARRDGARWNFNDEIALLERNILVDVPVEY